MTGKNTREQVMGMLVLENLKQVAKDDHTRSLYESSSEAKYELKTKEIYGHSQTYRGEDDENAEEESKHIVYQGAKFILREGFEGNEGEDPELKKKAERLGSKDKKSAEKLLAVDKFLKETQKHVKGKKGIAMWLREEGIGRKKIGADKITRAVPDMLVYVPPQGRLTIGSHPAPYMSSTWTLILREEKMFPSSRPSSLYLSVEPSSASRFLPAMAANP